MATAKIYENNGSERGTIDLPGYLFDCEVSEGAIHQAVVAYLANQRQGNASTKERSDVSGGGRKPFRQKGTGRARQGTSRSPLHRGGGVVFGPRPRSYRQQLPKKLKRLALRSSLTTRARAGSVLVVNDLDYAEPKTKRFAEMLRGLDVSGNKVLFIMDQANEPVSKSARNLPHVRVSYGPMVTTYDVMWADKIVLTESALKVMKEVFKQ